MKAQRLGQIVVLCFFLFSCGGDDTSIGESFLEIVSGLNQEGVRNQTLSEPIVIQLVDQNQTGIPETEITFQVLEGSGSINKTQLVTDQEGRVSFEWTLGNIKNNEIRIEFEGSAERGASEQLSLSIEAPYNYHIPEEQDDSWEVANAADEGFDVAKLENMINLIEDNRFSNIHGVLIMRNDKVVFEERFPEKWNGGAGILDIIQSKGDKHLSFSVTKSVASALVGIALKRGLIASLDDPIYSYFDYSSYENWTSTKQGITIKHALTMKTGLGCAEDSEWENHPDPTKYTLDLPLINEPGVQFNYCTEVSNVLGTLLEKASGKTLQLFAQQNLFGPMGITDVDWWITQERAAAGSSLYWRPRDMAKFGKLYLNNGNWNGNQILPEDYVELTTSVDTENTGWHHQYAYHWWKTPLLVNSQNILATSAVGAGGQRIFIIKELDMVVVITSGNFSDNEQAYPVQILKDHILAAMN